ncbi:MAG: hypothetical protein K6F52_01510 [Clostridia bacterium]|nr:hypothetical protein [Clostridia bacterium]
MEKYIIMGIEAVLLLTFAGGMGILCEKDLRHAAEIIKSRHRLNRKLQRPYEMPRPLRHMKTAVETVFAGRIGFGSFLGILLTFFLLAFAAALSQGMSIAAACAGSIVLASLPPAFLEIKLQRIRGKGSREAESFVGGFLAQYRIKGFNIFETMEIMAASPEGRKVCSSIIYTILLELRTTGDRERMRNITEQFGAVIDTNWSRIFSYNLYLAAAYGTNISAALEEILFQLQDARTLAEERKRLNGESGRITLVLVPLTCIITTLLCIFYLDVPPDRLFYNQFCTGTGLAFACGTGILFVANIFMLEIISNRKFDY